MYTLCYFEKWQIASYGHDKRIIGNEEHTLIQIGAKDVLDLEKIVSENPK